VPPPASETPITLAEPELVLARYGELWLKGKNRRHFENRLLQNVSKALKPISPAKFERERGTLRIVPERRTLAVATRLQDVFGISTLSPGWRVPSDPEAIADLAVGAVGHALEALPASPAIPFRVATKRAEKRFPMKSIELDRHVADRVMERYHERLTVDLENPELTLGIVVQSDQSFVHCQRLAGAGGLPVGTLGHVLCLLSGGIDSPVAAWMAMKRGCEVGFVSFHSYPFIGESSLLKIRRLVRRLARFQPESVLFTVPFAEVQTEIRDHAPEGYRTVLYRRMMHRIAEALGRLAKAKALVTGDSIGQVASQTLENLACIGAATRMPIFRPLACFDKSETIALARRIGTFDLSIVPEPDCCTVFQPQRPVIHGRLDRCEEAESRIDVDGLVAAAVEGTERSVLGEV